MATIGTLLIELSANVARLENDLGKASRHVQNTERMIQQSVGRMNSVFGMLGFTITGAGMVTFVKHSIDAQDELATLSERTGTAVTELAGLKYAAEQNSTSLESVANAGKKLSVTMVDKPELFKRLGINARTSTDAMVQMADLFASMPEGVEKTALAVKLMGKNGEEMIPFLNQGSESLRGLIERGKELTPVTAESAARAKEFNDQLNTLKTQAEGAGVGLANNLLPNLTQITGAMIEAAREGGLLKAALVGVGGVFAGIFTDDLLSREQKIAKELEFLRGNLDAETSGWARFMNGLSDTSKKRSEKEKNAINDRMIQLHQELDQIQKLRAEREKLAAGDKPKVVPQSVKDLLASGSGNDFKFKDNFEAEHDRWIKNRRAGMQVLIGLEGDYRDELAKRAEAMRMPLLSASEKALAEDLRTVSKRAQDARVDLEKLHVSGTLTADQYSNKLQQVTADEEKQKAAVTALRAEQDKLNQSWIYGANVALRTYLDEVQNTAKQSEQLVGNAFRGMEDELVRFVRTGKADIRSLVDSILADFLRIQMRQGITGPLASWMGGLLGGAGSGGSGYTGVVGGMSGLDQSAAVMATRSGGVKGKGGFDRPVQSKASGGGQVININDNTVFNVGDRSDRGQVIADLSTLIDQKQAQLVERLRREGAIA